MQFHCHGWNFYCAFNHVIFHMIVPAPTHCMLCFLFVCVSLSLSTLLCTSSQTSWWCLGGKETLVPSAPFTALGRLKELRNSILNYCVDCSTNTWASPLTGNGHTHTHTQSKIHMKRSYTNTPLVSQDLRELLWHGGSECGLEQLYFWLSKGSKCQWELTPLFPYTLMVL